MSKFIESNVCSNCWGDVVEEAIEVQHVTDEVYLVDGIYIYYINDGIECIMTAE